MTICFVTGGPRLSSILDGTWKPMPASFAGRRTGRIKCRIESSGGFLNIAVSNCVFERSHGLALGTVDGALCEDITFTGIAMRDIAQAPLFLRLGKRMHGPAGTPVGRMRRILVSDDSCSGASMLPFILSGVPGHPLEDVQIHNAIFRAVEGGTPKLAGACRRKTRTATPSRPC